MKLVFLDYDGVINTILKSNGRPNLQFFHPRDGKVNNPEAVKWLNLLCLETGAKIVVTSSWRNYSNYQEVLRNSGLDDRIKILGKTPEFEHRYQEIQAFLDSFPYEIENFVILDDAPIKCFSKNQVKCSIFKGLNFKKYKEALRILM